jgi:hypothetical protein
VELSAVETVHMTISVPRMNPSAMLITCDPHQPNDALRRGDGRAAMRDHACLEDERPSADAGDRPLVVGQRHPFEG